MSIKKAIHPEEGSWQQQVLDNSKEEIEKILLDQAIYGIAFHRVTEDGKVEHIPYTEGMELYEGDE